MSSHHERYREQGTRYKVYMNARMTHGGTLVTACLALLHCTGHGAFLTPKTLGPWHVIGRRSGTASPVDVKRAVDFDC
jgi:hypothetical protein